MLKETRQLCAATSRKGTTSRYTVQNRAPINYYYQSYGILNHKDAMPRMRGAMLWRKWLKEMPRVYKWEREDPAEHMKRFHRADVSWNGLRFQYLTVPDEMWPKVTLKSEELHLREVDSWRDAYRLHIEGYFGNLRQRHHVSVPNNYNILQRYMKAMAYARELAERNKQLPKFHPPHDKLLDFEL
eukprot:TRINITY_DN6697_c0_g1_i1.p1 TRINITY_DN6697_c0_g1~~TRINITY_DN6697_c0_g1_i1.p1  ORF type:complete len:185 (+),score=45.80 TRINITY_DN6697_c0_g1_i1:361-915(+)